MKHVVVQKNSETKPQNVPRINARYVQCFLMFLGIGISGALRTTLSVAIVSMTDGKHTISKNVNVDWSEQIKSLLLSGYAWGSLMSQIPSGQLSKRYGAKYIFLISILFASITSILTPILTIIGNWQALLIIRAIEGFFNGFSLPALFTSLSKWVPQNERGSLCLFTLSGINLLITIMLATSGPITYNFGWEFIFYIWGSFGILWSIIYLIYGSSSPAEHTTITDLEKNYIYDNLKETLATDEAYIPTPWLHIFRSVPFYAVLLSQCTGTLAFQITLLNIPRYLNGVFGFSIQNSGLFSSLPHIVRWLANFVFITINYFLNRHTNFSLQWNRKFFNTIAQLGPAIGFVGLAYVTVNYSNILMLCLVSIPFFNAASGLGNDINHIDLAPNHAGILLGICNFVMGIVTIAGTNFVGIIVSNAENQSEWQIIFLSAAGAISIGGVIFLIFGSTHVQKWNNLKKYQDLATAATAAPSTTINQTNP